ncbi:MAG: GAF domain-containing protein [Ahniella sp.]|nr:GAF domain-containing protein [Ahniella sp.]
MLALAEPVTPSEARQREARARSRRDSITQLQAIGPAAQTPGETLQSILLQLMQIAECERGMLFEVNEGRIVRTLATQGIEADNWSRGGFSGSHGAVERALADRAPVFLSKAADATGMAGRASVISGGIGALAALPLLQAPDQLIGLCYLDSLDSERSFTELDGELLGAFSGRAATMLALALVDARIEALSRAHRP